MEAQPSAGAASVNGLVEDTLLRSRHAGIPLLMANLVKDARNTKQLNCTTPSSQLELLMPLTVSHSAGCCQPCAREPQSAASLAASARLLLQWTSVMQQWAQSYAPLLPAGMAAHLALLCRHVAEHKVLWGLVLLQVLHIQRDSLQHISIAQ